MSYSVIFITASNAAEAGNIAASLVKEELAACANVVGGVSSTYWWKGNIETADEVLVIAKSKTALVEKIISHKPEKFLCLDRAFEGNDQLKTNTVLQMRDAGVDFKTI